MEAVRVDRRLRYPPLHDHRMRARANWQWHLDEMYVNVGDGGHEMWRAVDHEGKLVEAFVTRRRDRQAAFRFLGRPMKRPDRSDAIVAGRLRSRGAADRRIGGSGLILP